MNVQIFLISAVIGDHSICLRCVVKVQLKSIQSNLLGVKSHELQKLNYFLVTVDENFSVFDGKGPTQFEKRKKSIENGVEDSLDFQDLMLIPDWEGTKDVLLLSGR